MSFCPDALSKFRRVLATTLACALLLPLAASGQLDNTPSTIRVPKREKQIVPLHKKEVSLEDLFPKTDFAYAYPQPVDLQGLRIAGLTAKSAAALGTNLFVVINNIKYASMAELYRDNRLKGKSNFVTVDSIMHPYLAFRNEILARTIEEHLAPDLLSLLAAMLKSSAADYKQADDAEVREDVERNLAYLSVAIKLLDPSMTLPAMGNATVLVEKELQNIKSARKRRSVIFDVDEDFSCYRPYGWYNTSASLHNFYRSKQWLSRMSFPLTEAKSETSGDAFRRSALLFRSLEKSTVRSQPGIAVWQKIYTAWLQLGPVLQSSDKTLLVTDYKEVFKNSAQDLHVSLQSLAEPFFRTKLLLSVRRQRPLQMSSTSIFDIDAQKSDSDTRASFRFLPTVEESEQSWLKEQAHSYAKEGSDVPAPPLALLDLHAHGIAQSTNVLAENVWKLSPALSTTIPPLVQMVKKQILAKPDPIWPVLAAYFKPPPEAIQSVLKTNAWMTRKLESGFSAWVDNQLAISVSTAKEPDPPAVAPVKAASFHYLEPCPEVFRTMRTEEQRLNDNLNAIGYFPETLSERHQDFSRLLQRLDNIAGREANGQLSLGPDLGLLANIDLVLDKISPPTAGTIFLDTGAVNDDAPKGSLTTGATIGLGRPGLLFIIMHTGRGFTLARGAMYAYYELPGGPIKPEHWSRKLDFSLLRPPTWADQFDLIQDQTSGTGAEVQR